MIDIDITSKLIDEKLKEKGIEKFAYTVSENKKEELTAKNSIFSLLRTTLSSSLSLTVFKDGRKGTGKSFDISREALDKTIDDALLSAISSDKDEAYDIAPMIGRVDLDRGDVNDLERFYSRLEELLNYIKVNYPNILVMDTVGEHNHFNTLYHNSNGTYFRTQGGFYDFYLGYSAHDGDVTSGKSHSEALTKTLECPFIDLGSIAYDLLNKSKCLLTTSTGDKFTGTVIFTPACLGQFLTYIFDSISDTMIQSGLSLWKDKLNEKVADEGITIFLESSNPEIVMGELITDDGFKSEDVPIIENGILKSFLLSLYASRKTGNSVTKNSSRDVVMDGGEESLKEIISRTERGLIVGAFSGGYPSVNGDFSGVAKSSFYIEGGKIKGAVNETMINGNLFSMLQTVSGISKERQNNGSAILPFLAVDGIVISGR